MIDSDGDKNIIKVSAISNIIEIKKTGQYYIDVGGYRIDCKVSNNEEVLENLIDNIKGQ